MFIDVGGGRRIAIATTDKIELGRPLAERVDDDCACNCVSKKAGEDGAKESGWDVEMCKFHEIELRNNNLRAFFFYEHGAWEITAGLTQGVFQWKSTGFFGPPTIMGEAGLVIVWRADWSVES